MKTNTKLNSLDFPMKMDFDKQNAIYSGSDEFNRFGLDLTNPDIIKFEESNIAFEIRGGVLDSSLTYLKVGLTIQKKFNTSATDIYRTQSIDLFNENQLEYLIKQASSRIKVDTDKFRNAVFSLASKLDEYKKDKLYSAPKREMPTTDTKTIKEVKDFLKTPNLINNLQSLFEKGGMPDGKLAIKLFLVSLSRLTKKPLHAIIQGDVLLSHDICNTFGSFIGLEDFKEATSLSPTVISHVPYPSFWDKKLLLMHQLQGALNKKDTTLEEYMVNDHLNRFITEQNIKTGAYKLEQKKVNDTFSILGYTNQDFHKVFNSANVVCMPLSNTKNTKEKMNEWELKKYAGMLDFYQIEQSKNTIQHIQRLLEPLKIINPYIEQIDFQSFFENDVKKIRQFMQLTNLVTMLHRFQLTPKKKDGELYFEVQPQFMLDVLELYKELWVTNYDQLYFQVLCTLKQIKRALMSNKPQHQNEDRPFSEKEMHQLLKIHPATFNRHIQKLILHTKIQRIGGNNRTGFEYKVVDWSENKEDNDKFEAFRHQLLELSNSTVSHPLKTAV